MATGQDFVRRALIKAGIRTAESPLSSDEIEDGLEQFNDMMASQEASGILLGFTPLENASDTVTVPRYAHGSIKATLAIYFTSEYGRVASRELIAEASNLHDQLLRTVVHIPDVSYPSTLPLGSGNVNADLDVFDNRFFPADKQDNF